MSEAVIVLDHLSKSFGNVHAVQDLSLQIESGSIFGFLGPNGAGKTTTMRMLCGLTHPTGGHATIEGADVWKDRQRVRTKFGYVPQRFSLYRDLTVMEDFRFFGGAYGVPGDELERRIKRLLRVIDLAEERNAAAQSLSGGMRQLLAIGCALVHNPSLLFSMSRLQVSIRFIGSNLEFALRSSHEGRRFFVTTHYMDKAERARKSVSVRSDGCWQRLLARFEDGVFVPDCSDSMSNRLCGARSAPRASRVARVSLRSGGLRLLRS